MDGCVPWPEECVEEYRNKGYWEDIPLGVHFDGWVEKYSDRPAILWEDEIITYKQLGERTIRLAFQLTKRGVRTYDRVIFQLLNTPELFYLLYACFKIGAIPICSLPLHRWSEISYFVEKAGAEVHAIPTGNQLGFDYEGFALKIRDSYPQIKLILTAGRAGNQSMESINDLIEADVDLEEAQNRLADFKPDPLEPALFQLSGGTTGVPKLIPRTHNDYYYNAKCHVPVLGYDENTRSAIGVPMVHNAPMVAGILPIHMAGGALIPCPPKTAAILKAATDHKANILNIAPVFIHSILALSDQELSEYDLSSVSRLLWGGNPVPVHIQMAFREKFNVDSDQVYGMSEGLACWTRADDSLKVKLTTQGRPVSEADEVLAVDPNTNRSVPVGEIGECWTRGPYTIRGYYDAADYNKTAFTEDGFYKTGDLIRIDEHGNITVVGRVKDCISRGAEKINAEEVEDHIVTFPKVENVAVVAMPDEALGEKICAFVILKGDEAFTLDELADYLLNERKIAKYKVPERVEFVTELPTTPVGKFEKKSLRKKIREILKSEGQFYGVESDEGPKFKSIKQAFDHMAEIFDSIAAMGVHEVFQLNITGTQASSWHVEVNDGSCHIAEGTHAEPTVVITMSDQDFLDLRSGETNGQTLLMEGRLHAEGNIMAASYLTTIFPIRES